MIVVYNTSGHQHIRQHTPAPLDPGVEGLHGAVRCLGREVGHDVAQAEDAIGGGLRVKPADGASNLIKTKKFKIKAASVTKSFGSTQAHEHPQLSYQQQLVLLEDLQ